MQKITPFLWFDDQAEEAANHYVSIFGDSGIDEVTRYGDEFPDQKGRVMTVGFHLGQQRFVALNGGPSFPFTEAISFVVHCEDQAEVDHFWGKLSDGGEEGRCGWLKDKYGVSWQVVPKVLGQLLGDPSRAPLVTKALLKMSKLDVRALTEAGAA